MSEKRKKNSFSNRRSKVNSAICSSSTNSAPATVKTSSTTLQPTSYQQYTHKTSNWNLHFSRAYVCIKSVYFASETSETRYQQGKQKEKERYPLPKFWVPVPSCYSGLTEMQHKSLSSSPQVACPKRLLISVVCDSVQWWCSECRKDIIN